MPCTARQGSQRVDLGLPLNEITTLQSGRPRTV